MSKAPVTKRFAVIGLDFIAVTISYILAFLLRFDFSLNATQLTWLMQSLPLAVGAQFAAFFWFDIYRGIWRYSSFSDLLSIAKAVVVGAILSVSTVLFVHHASFPRSILLNFPILTFLCIGGVRFGIRWGKTHFGKGYISGVPRKVLLIGAGDLGESVLRQILKTPEANYSVVGLIDDNRVKWGLRIHDHTVFGGRAILPDLLKKYPIDEIIIAIATQRAEIVTSVMRTIREMNASVELKIAPSLEEMLAAPAEGVSLRKIKPADLLNRKAVELDTARIQYELSGKTVLITGAGGTIGAELARQVLEYCPEKLLILENHATSLFYVGAELKEKCKGTEIIPILGDARDEALIERIFNAHNPKIVLHAAAHKHLPQLEQKINIHEGVQNNVFATYALADAAHRHSAEAFLLISTDKAVRPSSVMGMTKRVAEIATRSFTHVSKTRFMSVRFGNVLGSSGSMLRIFQEQIANRRPINVTHPQATRYFMLVEEAVQLILQAATIGKGGEIFTLNMGTPMNILELAKNLILLSGLEPEKDIPINITGLRPGEKLHEELFDDVDQRMPTHHADIFITKPNGIDFERTIEDIRALKELMRGETAPVLKKMHEIIHQKDSPSKISSSSATSSEDSRPRGTFSGARTAVPNDVVGAPAPAQEDRPVENRTPSELAVNAG